jgi:hypothetical protein
MKTSMLPSIGAAALLVLALCPAAFRADTSAKTAHPAIYNEDADGGKQIAAALVVAKKE